MDPEVARYVLKLALDPSPLIKYKEGRSYCAQLLGETKLSFKRKRDPENAEQSSGKPVLSPKVLVHVDNIRLDGMNFHNWKHRMEHYVLQSNLRRVLRKPCPIVKVAPEASPEEIAESQHAEETWKKDDSLCFHTLLNHLSDDLFCHYSKQKKTTARQLWDELIFRFGPRPESWVRNYMEFQMLEEIPIVEQVQELNMIFSSLVSSRTEVDEQFHVNVIISKLPQSWEDVCFELMSEEHLPRAKLMDRLRAEEESRNKEKEELVINNKNLVGGNE